MDNPNNPNPQDPLNPTGPVPVGTGAGNQPQDTTSYLPPQSVSEPPSPPPPDMTIPPPMPPSSPQVPSQDVPSTTDLSQGSAAPTWPPAPQSPQAPLPQTPSFDATTPTTPFSEPQTQPQLSTGTSPLDNPWNVPTQPPPLGVTLPVSNPPTGESQPSLQDSTPTDLSHLISGNNNLPNQDQFQTADTPETLVVPSGGATTNEAPAVPLETNHKGIPKWLIGLGIGLLIVVAGASAYFILGIGQKTEEGSIPATQAPKSQQQVKPAAPIATPPAATGSGSFGQLEGTTPSPQATSAADLLRQRQQGR